MCYQRSIAIGSVTPEEMGAWKPGESTLADYLRCVRGRILRAD